jgi:hypothetical protein
MKALQGSWGRCFSMIGVCVVLGVGSDALGADPPELPPAVSSAQATARTAFGQTQGTAKSSAATTAVDGKVKPAPEPLKLKVFRLKYDEPQNVMVAAQILLSPPGSKSSMVGGLGGLGSLMPGGAAFGGLVLGGMPGVGIGGIGGLGGGVGGIGGIGGIGGAQLGALGGAGLQGGQLGALGGGLGALGAGFGLAGGPIPGQGFGIAGGPAGPAPEDLQVQGVHAGATRLAADTPSRTLMVRGPDADQKFVADIITVLNAAPGKSLPKIKNLRAFRLKHADPDAVAKAVALLGIDARLAPLRGQNGEEAPDDNPSNRRCFVFVRGAEEQIREIAEIIEGMDVPPKDEGAAGA